MQGSIIEQDDSNSLLIAATNHPTLLDHALFRRFDDVIEYLLPGETEIVSVLKSKLAGFKVSKPQWKRLAEVANGLSYGDITRACEAAIKDAIIHDRQQLTQGDLVKAIEDRQRFHNNFGEIRFITCLMKVGNAFAIFSLPTQRALSASPVLSLVVENRQRHPAGSPEPCRLTDKRADKYRESVPGIVRDQKAFGLDAFNGIYLSFESEPYFDLKFDSREFQPSGIELCSVKRVDNRDLISVSLLRRASDDGAAIRVSGTTVLFVQSRRPRSREPSTTRH